MRALTLMGIVLAFFACSNDDNVVDNNNGNGSGSGSGQNSNEENTILYKMPAEETIHEGTWLQWPHNYVYEGHTDRHDASWVAMTKALHTGERVHIVAYNQTEKVRIEGLLQDADVDMNQIDFLIAKTDDYWIRDNGPIFVYDENDNLVVQNWGFNGWGNKAPYQNCNQIPTKAANHLGLQMVNVAMINEGGSVEIDGHGTMMAKKSSIINSNRNPGLTQADVETYFRRYLGITNFIWLEGYAGYDITDDHIDGTARFANENTIITLHENLADPDEFAILSNATNANGESYNIITLPETQNNLPGSNDKGIYINFYTGNDVVLVPNFNDPNDAIVNGILQQVYPDKTIVGIPAIEMAYEGGGVHCVTQQQPIQL